MSDTVFTTRAAIERLHAREQTLVEREKKLSDELSAVATERRLVAADRETLERAEAIQARVFKDGGTIRVSPEAVDAAEGPVGQARARIGPQRYAMLATLRQEGRLDVVQLAHLTQLSVSRVKEQMRADQPLYVLEETLLGSHGGSLKLYLTDAGASLLRRFEEYRVSQGKPLPPLVCVDGQEDEEVDPAHSKSHEAGVQGPQAQGREAVPGGGT